MDDLHRMTQYTESRLEDLQAQARDAQLTAGRNPSIVRALTVFTALLIGLAVWWML